MRVLYSLQLHRNCDVLMCEYLGKNSAYMRYPEKRLSSNFLRLCRLAQSLLDYEHGVVVITANKQPYDIARVARPLLDVEDRQQDNMLHISLNSVAFNVYTASLTNIRYRSAVPPVHPSLNVVVNQSNQCAPSHNSYPPPNSYSQNNYGRWRGSDPSFNTNKTECKLASLGTLLRVACFILINPSLG